jgi:phage terminase large subunit-like protein
MALYDELEGFPFANHDDIVDALSGAFNRLTLGGELRPAGSLVRNIFRYTD